ncbi:MAG: glycerol-3-phosphate 1-O-acyltransferase PlsY [Candidatus Omnitrophica bacterium]|nr:glycerol-3-phosphate 1-O-acyltransferase PlsY [Candidatus Omnitrophota bacterium]
MLNLFFSFLASYLLGSIPTAYIYGRTSKGIDIRNYGSRNIGATNTLRVLGKKAGLIVLSADLIKGLIAVLFIAGFFYRLAPGTELLFFKLISGVGVVLGHTCSLFLRFRGGKGVATTMGVLLGTLPLSAFFTFAVWLSFLFLFGYVSLASICASLLLPLSIILFYTSNPQFLGLVLFAIVISLVVVIKHRANIIRLIYKQEKKIFRVYA